MVKIRVSNINFGDKEFNLKKGLVSEIFDHLKLPDDGVIVVDDSGDIYTKDRKLKDGMHVNIIEVFSGG